MPGISRPCRGDLGLIVARIQAPPGRTLAVIASTMRSGSTLLKALLQQAPDVSRLNEVDFQPFARPGADGSRLWELDPRPILLLKRPAWYHETGTYPRLPDVVPRRVILLVRDCQGTVESLRKMTFGPLAGPASLLVDRWLARGYWAKVTGRLADLADAGGEDFRLVRYEDLVSRPIDVTAGLFRWLGSAQQSGVDQYQPPTGGGWRWGRDDNSPRIRTLKVQAPRDRGHDNGRLTRLIRREKAIGLVRSRLGYPPL